MDDDRWFRSVKEIVDDFNYGTFDQMIVFRHCGGELHFQDALTRIILDDPELKTKKSGIDVFSMAFGALQLACGEGGLTVPIARRICSDACSCLKDYARDSGRTTAMFSPKLRPS